MGCGSSKNAISVNEKGRKVKGSKSARITEAATAEDRLENDPETEKFRNKLLKLMNQKRAKYGAQALELNDELVEYSQNWCQECLDSNSDPRRRDDRLFQAQWDGGEGEDMEQPVADMYIQLSNDKDLAANIVNEWYAAAKNYDYSRTTYSSEAGCFTQLVWRSTQEIGIGKVVKEDDVALVVVTFLPGGNLDNEYETNVKPSGTKVEKFLTPKILPLDVWREKCLAAHNVYRRKHNVQELRLHPDLNKQAQEWCGYLVEIKQMVHRQGEEKHLNGDPALTTGENLASATNKNASGQEITDMWYNEIKDYDFSSGGFSMNTGHFTQVVWKNTTDVGFGRIDNYFVANYLPAGNMSGEFEENVSYC